MWVIFFPSCFQVFCSDVDLATDRSSAVVAGALEGTNLPLTSSAPSENAARGLWTEVTAVFLTRLMTGACYLEREKKESLPQARTAMSRADAWRGWLAVSGTSLPRPHRLVMIAVTGDHACLPPSSHFAICT